MRPTDRIRLSRVAIAAGTCAIGAVLIGAAGLASAAPVQRTDEAQSVWDYLAQKYDADDDGIITRAEYGRGADYFDRLDKNGDGQLTAADTERGPAGARGGGRGGGGRGGARGGGARGGGARTGEQASTAPTEGQRAPDFTIEVLQRPPAEALTAHARAVREALARGESAPAAPPDVDDQPLTLRLSDYAVLERPVALIFGSYT